MNFITTSNLFSILTGPNMEPGEPDEEDEGGAQREAHGDGAGVG